jgi:signal transduction histidine kinase
MAHRLVAGVRDADTVSRHGGDEFVILLTEIAQPVDARRIADQLRTALAAPSRIGDTVLRLTASVGISIYPDDGDDVQTLVQCADAAMYQAKRQRLGSLNFHDAQATAPGLTDGAAAAPVAAALNDPISRHGAAVEIQRQRYAELREANEQLVLAALSARDMQAAAERAHRDQTEFMDLLARELANPLAPIRLAAAMLGQVQSAEPLLPRAQSIIERQVRSMTHLVTAVQDVASAGRSTFGLVRKIVDMASVVDAAVGACRPAMDVRLQTFTVQWPDPPAQAQVLGEAGRLEQVARNLLDNASQYTPDLGWIRLVLAVQGDEVELTVSDSGIGITAIALPTIFEPFAQDIAAIGIRDVGPGVGLAVVRALVQAHGGTVLASSAGTGRGSRFTVTLPLARTSASAPEVARSVTPHDNGPDSPGPGATE